MSEQEKKDGTKKPEIIAAGKNAVTEDLCSGKARESTWAIAYSDKQACIGKIWDAMHFAGTFEPEILWLRSNGNASYYSPKTNPHGYMGKEKYFKDKLSSGNIEHAQINVGSTDCDPFRDGWGNYRRIVVSWFPEQFPYTLHVSMNGTGGLTETEKSFMKFLVDGCDRWAKSRKEQSRDWPF